MATATREAKITITLVMNKTEAIFLRDLTQNRIVDDRDTTQESDFNEKARESIFTAVDTGLKKRK